MSRSKLVFIVLAILFMVALILLALDFSSKTTFPGQKNNNTEQAEADSVSQEEEAIN